MSFFESHWGDIVALCILFTGIVVYVKGFQEMGQSLVFAALVGLKLRGKPIGNGNGPQAT